MHKLPEINPADIKTLPEGGEISAREALSIAAVVSVIACCVVIGVVFGAFIVNAIIAILY